MRRLLLVALVAALAIGVAQSESPEMQQEEDCDPSLIEADSSEGSASLSSSSAAFAPYHVGVAAGNPNNRQPFVSAAEAGMQPPIVDARPPVVIVQQPARRACKKASTSNIKLKNNNAVQEISLPEGADISEYADLLNGDFNPAQKAAASSSSSSSSSAKRSSSSSGSEKMSSLSHGLYGESSSRHSKKSESSLFSGSFGESSRHTESGRRESSIGSLSPLSSQSQRQSNSFNSNQGNNNQNSNNNNNNNGNSNNNNNNNGNSNNNNNGNSNNQNNNNNQRSENSLSFSDSHSGSESGTNTLFSNSGSGSGSNTNSGSALNSNTQGSLANSGSQQAALSAQRQRAPFGNAVVGSSVMSVDAASLKRVIDRRTFFLTQKRLFKTSIHFRAGVNSFRLFDYAPSKANPNDPDNLGGYHDEWKAFPDAWANMLKTLGEVGITLRKDKKIYLHIAGFSSSKYPGRPEHFALSERRATATACYLAAWLRAQGMPNFAFKIGFYGDKYASGQDPLSYAKDRRVDIMYALNTESYKNFIPQFHWKGGSTIKKGGHDGGLSEYCSRNANWRRPDFQDSYLQYAGPNTAPAGASAVAGGASGSSGSSNIDPETFEGVMFGSGSAAVQASAAALSASAGSSSLAASLSAQQRSSSSSGVAAVAGVPSLSASLSGLPVSSSVASAALPVASSVAGSGSALPANSIHSSLSNTGLPSTSAPASSSAAAAASSAQPSATTVPTGPRGPLIKLQNSNQAVIHDTPHPPRRSRRGFVIGKGPQPEGSKTVFGSPITGQ